MNNKLNTKYIIIISTFILLSAILLASCLKLSRKTEIVHEYDDKLREVPDIRVLLLKNIENAKIEISCSYKILDASNEKVLAQGPNLPKSKLYISSGQFRIQPLISRKASGTSFPLKKIRLEITSGNEGYIDLDNTKYRGKLLVIPVDAKRFSVLEEIDIEDYLPGVIAGEVPIKWQDDAIFAQIIAVRSYAIYQRKTRKNAPYHIDKLGLAYQGSYSIHQKIKRMVDQTSGVVMVYNWEMIPGYFHSTCGGHTENINHVFGFRSIQPLSGVNCGHCKKSKYYRWTKKILKSEIKKRLRKSGIKIGNIKEIITENVGPGDHCSTIKVKHSKGINSFDANTFRLMVGPGFLRSTAFNVKDNGSSLIFKGKGWGHGVGLCQYGMQDMAKSGTKWYDILKHYYPGIDLVKIY